MFLRHVTKRYVMRHLAILGIALSLLCLIILLNNRSSGPALSRSSFAKDVRDKMNWQKRLPAAMEVVTKEFLWSEPSSNLSTCPVAIAATTDVVTGDQFRKFNLEPRWIKSREFWDSTFEERYKKRRENWDSLPLKVILMPHSHTDPGWLKTFDDYHEGSVRHILNNMVVKLQEYGDMTFIWTEISFFSLWWKDLHPRKRKMVKQFIKEGRLEFTSGSWVMTDEATTHLYSMLDQITEGHQWLKANLGVTPLSVWSVDPFGHGPVAPYLMRSSGLNNTVIQRIHYSWKQFFAAKQTDDFLWRQSWDARGSHDILCHNLPFDIYSIKHSCGPNPSICVNYDFRKIRGEFTEYSMKANPVDQMNIKEKAEVLLEQYGRLASLFQHNIALIPIGDDFRYNKEEEWDQQYKNYKQLSDYINKNRDKYKADISFGTLSDYFHAIRSRQKSFTTLQGDFFVYSDVFTDGNPAYWSGYFSTRPYWKSMARELESNLRSAEILYTFSSQRARQTGSMLASRVLDKEYTRLVKARRELALFQHHDAITGTSKAAVMVDYGQKLYTALRATDRILRVSAGYLLSMEGQFLSLTADVERETFDENPARILVDEDIPSPIKGGATKIVLYNSDPHFREEIVKIKVSTADVTVRDSERQVVPHQVNPVWTLVSEDSGYGGYASRNSELHYQSNNYEVVFIADLEPLSLAVYEVTTGPSAGSNGAVATVFKGGLSENGTLPFDQQPLQPGDIQLENSKIKIRFDGPSGLIRSITNKVTKKVTDCQLVFGAYQSTQFRSGAYLFKPETNPQEPFVDILRDQRKEVIIVTGPVMSEITVLYGSLLVLSTVIYHKKGSILESGIYVEHFLNFGNSPKYRENEVFMSLVTDIQNFGQDKEPVFFTDMNGFQMARRKRVPAAGIEGNYYPITSAVYIEDESRRMTLLVSRAHGSTSYKPGTFEVMLDRRMVYDDGRGMGEGVVDNKNTISKFWIILEDKVSSRDELPKPSLLAHRLSNYLLYPAKLYVIEDAEVGQKRVNFLTKPLPCDVNLINLRTLSDEFEVPSREALMVLHKLGYSCEIESVIDKCAVSGNATFYENTELNGVIVTDIVRTSLTGLHNYEGVQRIDEVSVPTMELKAYKLGF